MKVGIDVFGCDHAKSGLGSYIVNFIGNLPSDTDIEFELFGSEIDRYTYTSDNGLPYVSVHVPDELNSQRLWHRKKIKKFLKKQKYDLVIFPASESVIPKKCKIPSIIIVNTVVSSFIQNTKTRYTRQLKKGLHHCTKIIASSEYIKQDLIKLGYSKNKIIIDHTGVNHNLFMPMVNLEEDVIEISPFAIKRPYFIYATRLSNDDKKHDKLIEAFEDFKETTKLPHRLVIAGDFSNPDYSEKIQRLAFTSKFSSDIFLIGFFPYNSLPKLYGGAEAFIFPSINEGVGMPVLEAMACGVPILSSKEGALKEIAGNVPKYFDSDDIKEISCLMQDVVENPKLREKMISAGIERASGFDWKKTVNKILDVIKGFDKSSKSK